MSGAHAGMKRAFDLAAAIFGLLILSPLLICVALGVKLTSPGPILFSQIRVGRGGKLFRAYKFRTMIAAASQMGSSVTVEDDPRITRLGTILRKSKIDELPQMWNIIRGEMSFVGPRPDVPEIVAMYSPEMRRVLEYPPGITSIASLHLRNEEAILALVPDPGQAYVEVLVPIKVKLAMEHVLRDSFWFDLSVLAQTFYALTLGRIWPLPELPEIDQARRALAGRS